MKGRIALLIALILTSLTRGQEKWTLQQCFDYAVRNNINMKIESLQVDNMRLNYADAAYNRLPSLSAGSRATWNYGLTQNFTTGILENQTVFGNTWFASLQMPVFQAFGLRYAKKSAYYQWKAEETQWAIRRNELKANITGAFLQTLMTYENYRAAQAQWKASEEQEKKMRELIKEGLRPEGDLKDLQSQTANDYLRMIQAKNQWLLAKLNLAQLLELKEIDNFDVDVDPGHFPVDENLLLRNPEDLVRTYYPENPAGKKAGYNELAAKNQINMAKSRLYPSLNLFASWNSRFMDRERIVGAEIDPNNPYRIIGITQNTHENVVAPNFKRITGPPEPYFDQLRKNSGFSFGFALNIPVFSGFSSRRRVEKARIQWEQARLQKENAEKNFRNNVYKLYTDVLNAREKRDAARKNKEAAETAYRYAVEKMNLGLISPYDLANSKSRKIQAESQYISAKYEYLFKLKLLELTLLNP